MLLVEHDDSTRHIVGVLLRKCSYHVTAVADGLKAWEVMKERQYNVDLVLTEVEMPLMSGIVLLAKIAAAEECRNIPVIMMSSQDSIGVVLKCMLKGAADFLVKPVRKNELRNLWQHVWRKHCSGSYAASENNAASNHVSADADDKSTGENCAEGTDAQSSSSKPDTEVESNPKHIECKVANGRNLSGEEAMLEHSDNNIVAGISKMDDDRDTRGCLSLHFEQVPSEAHIDEGSTLANKHARTESKLTGSLHDAPRTDKLQKQNSYYDVSPYKSENLGFTRSREGYDIDAGLYYQNKATNDLVDFVEPTANEQYTSHILVKDALKQDAHVQNTSNYSTTQNLEISLRRPQLNVGTLQECKERLIVNHSNSAFSRYSAKRIPTSIKNLVSSASGIIDRECDDNRQSHACSHGTENEIHALLPPKEILAPHQGNVGEASCYHHASLEMSKEDGDLSSDLPKEDIHAGHSVPGNNTVFQYPQYGFIQLPIPFGATPYTNLCGYGTILQPVYYPETPSSRHTLEKETIQIPSDQRVHYDSHFSNNSLKFSHHDENHQSHHRRQSVDAEPQDSREACNPMEHAYQSGSCSHDILRGRGGYGSGEITDAAVNTLTALESGNESGIQNRNVRGLDYDRSHREAALVKFRLKRKDRCFEKKVRYYSRKKLAEQRPRVKGQFVRQKLLDPTVEMEADD